MYVKAALTHSNYSHTRQLHKATKDYPGSLHGWDMFTFYSDVPTVQHRP